MKPTRLFATIILASTAGAPIVTVVATCAGCQSDGFNAIADALIDAPMDRWSGIADANLPDGEPPDAGEGDAS